MFGGNLSVFLLRESKIEGVREGYADKIGIFAIGDESGDFGRLNAPGKRKEKQVRNMIQATKKPGKETYLKFLTTRTVPSGASFKPGKSLLPALNILFRCLRSSLVHLGRTKRKG